MNINCTEFTNGWLFVITDEMNNYYASGGMFPTKEKAVEEANRVIAEE
jgi:hypothetical protein